jgi:hypothetical protein
MMTMEGYVKAKAKRRYRAFDMPGATREHVRAHAREKHDAHDPDEVM